MNERDQHEDEFTLHRCIITYEGMKIHLKKSGKLYQFQDKLLAPYSLYYEDVSPNCKDVFVVAETYKSGDFIKRKIDRVTKNNYREYVYHRNGSMTILHHSGRPEIFYGNENDLENENDLYNRISSCESYNISHETEETYVSRDDNHKNEAGFPNDNHKNETGSPKFIWRAFWKGFFSGSKNSQKH